MSGLAESDLNKIEYGDLFFDCCGFALSICGWGRGLAVCFGAIIFYRCRIGSSGVAGVLF